MAEDQNNQNKKKIMIVDDDKFLLDMYSLKFQNEGLEVNHAFTGEELLDKLKAGEKADVILLDIIIPGLDGIDTLSKIREDKLAEGAKIIMLSNQSDPQEIERAKKVGIDGYIVKATATPSEVVSQVMAVIQNK